MGYKATLTIGRFAHVFDIPDLVPEVLIVAPTEPKMEYQLKARQKEIEELKLDLPKCWRFRLKNHNDKTKEAWYDFYAQE